MVVIRPVLSGKRVQTVTKAVMAAHDIASVYQV